MREKLRDLEAVGRLAVRALAQACEEDVIDLLVLRVFGDAQLVHEHLTVPEQVGERMATRHFRLER